MGVVMCGVVGGCVSVEAGGECECVRPAGEHVRGGGMCRREHGGWGQAACEGQGGGGRSAKPLQGLELRVELTLSANL